MANILQQVQTYQMSGLGFLLNLNCFISTANTKFKDFQNLTANLGDTVNFEKPPRFTTYDGLVVTDQAIVQRVQSLTVNKSKNVSFPFTAQEFVFNVEEYMSRLGEAAVISLASEVEADVATVINSSVYRWYGDPTNPVDSYQKLAYARALNVNYGAPKDKFKAYLQDLMEPTIVGSGLSQFALDRNNKAANSWEVGGYNGIDCYRSNLLPIHYAGNVGESGATLTLVSATQFPGGTQLTFSGAGVSDANAIKANDKLYFIDGVPGFADMRYLTWQAYRPSGNPVQTRVIADAASDGSGNVVVNVFPALISTPGDKDQNLNQPLVAGLQAKVLSTHRMGLMTSGDPLYLAMPALPDQTPFPTANKYDPDTGVSMRLTHGSILGQNQTKMIYDIIYGYTLVPEYASGLVFKV